MRISLRLRLANLFPGLGGLRRIATAYLNAIEKKRRSYSQHGEDQFIYEQLLKWNLSGSIYIDIGANHPSDLSNTYLLYRNGLHGITVEPDRGLSNLHRRFRPRDIQVGIGCGRTSSLGIFQVRSTPVLNSFISSSISNNQHDQVSIRRVEYVPILPLDKITEAVPHRFVSFLSIDTEGLDLEVLEGSKSTLERTLFLCVEAYTQMDEEALLSYLASRGFILQNRFGCNLILQNHHLNISEDVNKPLVIEAPE